jgi:hypothetical protein
MRRNRALALRFIALLSTIYVLFLIVTAPASLLGRAHFLPSGITLEQLEGRLWKGSAGKLNIASTMGPIQIQDVRWTVQWPYLLRGELALKLETAAAAGSLSVARGFDGVRLLHADLAMPAADLAQILAPLAAWQPGGEVQFQSDGFRPASITPGTAHVLWNNASLNLSPLQPLGDYRLVLGDSADKITARLETQSGKLQLTGSGEYSKASGIRFSGNAQADPGHTKELQALLAALGQDRGDGVHAFHVHLQ